MALRLYLVYTNRIRRAPDSICFGAIAADQSYGRQFDDDPVWINFPVPTPGATNTVRKATAFAE